MRIWSAASAKPSSSSKRYVVLCVLVSVSHSCLLVSEAQRHSDVRKQNAAQSAGERAQILPVDGGCFGKEAGTKLRLCHFVLTTLCVCRRPKRLATGHRARRPKQSRHKVSARSHLTRPDHVCCDRRFAGGGGGETVWFGYSHGCCCAAR